MCVRPAALLAEQGLQSCVLPHILGVQHMIKQGHGIELTGRNEEQPADARRARDSSSVNQDIEQHRKPEGQTKTPEDKRD
jgi:hypothetical protein